MEEAVKIKIDFRTRHIETRRIEDGDGQLIFQSRTRIENDGEPDEYTEWFSSGVITNYREVMNQYKKKSLFERLMQFLGG